MTFDELIEHLESGRPLSRVELLFDYDPNGNTDQRVQALVCALQSLSKPSYLEICSVIEKGFTSYSI